ncbi:MULTISPECIES: hypothetical protein [Streptomyces]|uniref:Uncharacterized protein n=1 Tax=Streptomyces rochei TaxID=1928 RepID=A0ABW7E1S9_STRRO|nr:hypothetical protein [Streptomyces sp. MBT28]
MTRGVPPFLLPTKDVVVASLWQLHEDASTVPLPAFLPDWDYSTDLHLTRTVRIDAARARQEAALPPEAPLLVTVEWTAAASQTSDRACRVPVLNGVELTATADIRGALLGGALILTTRLVLGADIPSTEPFVAQHTGDVLYEDTARTELQGTVGRLPTYVVDFAEAGFDPDARWHVELPTTLAEPAAAAVRVYLNGSDTEVVNAARKAAAPTAAQQRILAWMESDLTNRLVDTALRPEWRSTLSEYSDDIDSIGASLAALLSQLFPNESPDALAAMRDSEPGRFHSHLQGALRRMRAHRDDNTVSPAV